MILRVRTKQLQTLADVVPGSPAIQACSDTTTWIEFVLVDVDDYPLAGEPYEVRLPDQSLQRGELDKDGRVRFNSMLRGIALIRFPRIDALEWSVG